MTFVSLDEDEVNKMSSSNAFCGFLRNCNIVSFYSICRSFDLKPCLNYVVVKLCPFI